jgi:hypothetical protein
MATVLVLGLSRPQPVASTVAVGRRPSRLALAVAARQRGSNENTNGLLRDYFPKGTDLAHVSPEELQPRSAESMTEARPVVTSRPEVPRSLV